MCCSSEDALSIKSMFSCHQMPMMMRLEDQISYDDQLVAAFQRTRLDHEMHLSVNSSPKLVKLTNIMITLGAMNSHPEAIVDIVMAGANMVRLNMSHNEDIWHAITVQSVRKAGNILYRSMNEVHPIGVAMELAGPEIRIGMFRGDSACLNYAEIKKDSRVKLTTDDRLKRAGTASCFWVSYPELPRVCQIGDIILIDRCTVILRVTCIGEWFVMCKALKGGILKNNKLLQLINSAVELPMISEQDETHLDLAMKWQCDYIVVNFARNGNMIRSVKNSCKKLGNNSIYVLGKICSWQGLESIDNILTEADGIVLERAGLRIDVTNEKLFLAQKSVIAKCNKVGKPVIVTFHPDDQTRTKIDADLIVNTVLDGADSILLTTGDLDVNDTVELVKNVSLACRMAENARWQRQIFEMLSNKVAIPLDTTYSIAIGAVEISLKCNAAAIIVSTTTGRSAMLLSNCRPRCPIVAITRNGFVARSLQLYFAVHSLHYRSKPICDWTEETMLRIQAGIDYLLARRYAVAGDTMIVVTGMHQSTGFTKCIRVIHVPITCVRKESFNV